jgi:hypothetical protein
VIPQPPPLGNWWRRRLPFSGSFFLVARHRSTIRC